MSKAARWTAEDWMGLWLVAMLGGGAFIFRWLFIRPVETVGMCAAANAPAICVPRHYVLEGAYMGLFGWAALVIGALAFVRGWRMPGALAIGLGIAAVVNYDATRGVLGAALGLIAWLSLVTGRDSTA